MLRLFVVDDAVERIRDIEQEALFSFPDEDIYVLGARDMSEAERLFSEKKGAFDLVLLDLKLPESDEGGLELFQRFARQSPKTLYVLSSGSLAADECPQKEFPPGFPQENFRLVPKSAKREALLTLLRDLVAEKARRERASLG